MAARILMVDGREITIALSGKRVADALVAAAGPKASERFARFTTTSQLRVWVCPDHVTAIEDRPD